MAYPVIAENSTRCTEELHPDILNIYKDKVDDEAVADIIRKLNNQ